MFQQLCVILFTGVGGGVGFLSCITCHMSRGSYPGRGTFIGGGGQTPLEIHGIPWDTVNKRTVRILLECILV